MVYIKSNTLCLHTDILDIRSFSQEKNTDKSTVQRRFVVQNTRDLSLFWEQILEYAAFFYQSSSLLLCLCAALLSVLLQQTIWSPFSFSPSTRGDYVPTSNPVINKSKGLKSRGSSR